MLNVSFEKRGHTVHVSLSGRMDRGPECDSLSSTVDSEIERGNLRFAFDLRPFGGHVQRPSDGRAPRNIAFLQCVGSRDGTVTGVEHT